MTNCPDCGAENREDARFCDACGTRIEAEVSDAQTPVAAEANVVPEDQGLALSLQEDDAAIDSTPGEDASDFDLVSETESENDAIGVQVEAASESTEDEDELAADSTETEYEPPVETPKAGYLVFPDSTEQPIPESQWLIGRADLAKYLPDPGKANEISRGHLTVFQEGDRFYVEDGSTMVQRKPSANKTWLVRGSSRILVTGTGRTELQDEDEIDVAELVKLQFVMK